MPSLSTRRRRAALGAASTAALLEGGGSRGLAATDGEAATAARLDAYHAAAASDHQLRQRAHLLSFPLFLAMLLALLSRPLHLSLATCLLLPLTLGALAFVVTRLLERMWGEQETAKRIAENGERQQSCAGQSSTVQGRAGQSGSVRQSFLSTSVPLPLSLTAAAAAAAGTPFFFLLLVFCVVGVMLSQLLFRDKIAQAPL